MVKQTHNFPNVTRTKPAYLYARFSSNNQREGHSIERQLTYGLAFAQERGWAVVENLTDEAKSAFKGANRIEGSALFEFERKAREGVFQNGAVLVCENVDRLSRQGAKASAKLIWALNEAGVDVATYHDGHVYKAGDDTDMMDLFSVIIKASVAHEESAKKSKRSNAGWSRIHSAIANGDKRAYSRQCPAWLDIVDEKYVLNEHRSKLLKQIFQWYCDGLGSLTILHKINALGEKPWSNEKRYKDREHWTPRYVHKLLSSRAAIGEYVTLKGDTLATDYYPAVVDTETFYRAQAVRANRKGTGGDERKRSANLFLGIAKCGHCGIGAVFTKRATTTGLHSYLRCNDARYKHSSCDNRAYIPYQAMEDTILKKALPMIAALKNEKVTLREYDTQLAELDRQIEVKQKQLDNIIEAIAEGVAAKTLAQKATTIEAEIEALNVQVASVRQQRGIEAAKPAKNYDVDEVNQLREELNDPDENARFEARARINSIFSRLFRAIHIHSDRTFRLDVDSSLRVTFDIHGNVLGYGMDNKIRSQIDDILLLIEDRDAIVDQAFKAKTS